MDKRPQFESIEQMAAATASRLVQAAAGSAFHLFNDKQFRRLARFDQLSQTEHDRIFNELVVGLIVLIMLLLEAPDLRADRDFRDYFRHLIEIIPKAYVDCLKELGIEDVHLKDWEKLIGMRYEEYARDKHDVRAAAMQLESQDNNLNVNTLSDIQLFVPLQAVAIGTHHHICRGKTDGRDDLFKLILNSQSQFYVELRVMLEGGKITPMARAIVAVKRFFRRLRKKE